ncbi:hypothetical protein OROGR_030017 [Orobanche gracilis]
MPSTIMNSLLHSAPPALHFPPLEHDGIPAAGFNQLKTHLRVLANITSKRKPKGQTDDYHSTLRALNSKGTGHYMVDSSVNEELVAGGNVKEGDLVLEIGPGTGSLTNMFVVLLVQLFLLLKRGSYMAALVRERFAEFDRVKFHQIHLQQHYPNASTAHAKSGVDAAIVAFKLKKTMDYPRVSSIKSFVSMECLKKNSIDSAREPPMQEFDGRTRVFCIDDDDDDGGGAGGGK